MTKYIFEAEINRDSCNGCPFHFWAPNLGWHKCGLKNVDWENISRPFNCSLQVIEDGK